MLSKLQRWMVKCFFPMLAAAAQNHSWPGFNKPKINSKQGSQQTPIYTEGNGD